MSRSGTSPYGEIIERTGVGIAAGGGLIMASCLNALPAATCSALAQTYSIAIEDFGVAALAGLMAVFYTGILQFSRNHYIKKYGALIFLVFGVSYFVSSVFAGQQNLQIATKMCFVGTATSLARNAHENAPLMGPFSVWKNLF